LAEGCKNRLLDRLRGRIPGQQEAEAQKRRTQLRRLEEKAKTLIRLHTNGDISYEEFRGERSLNEAAKREVRERLDHVTAGFDKEERDVKTGLGILSNLGLIWDRCGTVQQRRQFAKLLFSRVTVDGNSRLRGWALNNPFSSFSNSPSPVQNLF
jgi:hypothetical protein